MFHRPHDANLPPYRFTLLVLDCASLQQSFWPFIQPLFWVTKTGKLDDGVVIVVAKVEFCPFRLEDVALALLLLLVRGWKLGTYQGK
jgi:hypothetical protein